MKEAVVRINLEFKECFLVIIAIDKILFLQAL